MYICINIYIYIYIYIYIPVVAERTGKLGGVILEHFISSILISFRLHVTLILVTFWLHLVAETLTLPNSSGLTA